MTLRNAPATLLVTFLTIAYARQGAPVRPLTALILAGLTVAATVATWLGASTTAWASRRRTMTPSERTGRRLTITLVIFYASISVMLVAMWFQVAIAWAWAIR